MSTALWWAIWSGLGLSLLSNLVMFRQVVRLARKLDISTQKLKTSRQAHAMDVQGLTAQLAVARKQTRDE